MIDAVKADTAFEEFVRKNRPRMNRVLVARFGVEVGQEAAAEAFAWAWANSDQVLAMANPAGYLYRVAQTSANRQLSSGRRVRFPVEMPDRESASTGDQLLSDDLSEALTSLTEIQRTIVLLVHAWGWRPREVAQDLEMTPLSVRSHLHRGLRELRKSLVEGTR